MHVLMENSTMMPNIFLLSSSVGLLVCSFHLVGQAGPLCRISLDVMPGAAPELCNLCCTTSPKPSLTTASLVMVEAKNRPSSLSSVIIFTSDPWIISPTIRAAR